MAVDKLVDSTQLNADLTTVANAIRTKGGTSASLAFPSEFVTAINAISSGIGLGYTLTPIAAQQSVTTGSNRQAALSNPLGTIQNGHHYVVIYDSVEYLTTCHVLWTNNYVIGDYAWATGQENDYVYPFAIVGYQGNIILCSSTASSTHTIKIDEINLYGAVNSCYLGTGTPSSSLGVDGDIYIST